MESTMLLLLALHYFGGTLTLPPYPTIFWSIKNLYIFDLLPSLRFKDSSITSRSPRKHTPKTRPTEN